MTYFIRLIIGLLALLCATVAFSQTGPLLHEKLQYAFDQVDPQYVPSHLLYDYGYPLSDLTVFDGQVLTSAQATYTGWQSLYASLYTMQYGQNTLKSPREVATQIMEASIAVSSILGSNGQSSPVTVPILYYNYQKLRSDALESNYARVVDGQIIPLSDSLIETRQILAAAPRRSWLKGATQTFIILDSLYFSNTTTGLPSLSVDLGDGRGEQIVNWNEPLQAIYAQNGSKDIRIRMQYPDGTLYEAMSQVHITSIETVLKLDPSLRYAGNPRQNILISSVSGTSANVTIVYAANDELIRKPLIVAEGFDAWHLLTPDDPTLNYEVNDFLNSINNGGINVDINREERFSDFLEENGYDLVFVDWTDGTAHPEDNAEALVEIIDWVNRQKVASGSTEPNTLMGLSMGGIVSARALMMCQERGIDHQVDLYISNDVPYQGANVPVAAQLALRHITGLGFYINVLDEAEANVRLKDLVPSLQQAFDVLNSPAARVLLRYQGDYEGDRTVLYDMPADHMYLESIRSFDYIDPAKTRIIALSNGHECGDGQSFESGASLLQITGSMDFAFVSNLVRSFLSPVLIEPADLLPMAGPVSPTNPIQWDLKMNALPDEGTARVYRNKLSFHRQLVPGLEVEAVLTDVNIYSREGMLPLDNAPGGIIDLGENSFDVPEEVIQLLPVRQVCFVPTVSALNVQGLSGEGAPKEALYLRYSPDEAMPQGLQTPFDNYLTENMNNEPHLLLSWAKGRWLANEMEAENREINCAGWCDLRPAIQMPGRVCSGEEVTLSVNNPSNFGVNWTLDPRLEVVSLGENAITVRVPLNATGETFDARVEIMAGNCGVYRSPIAQLKVSDLDQITMTGELQGSSQLYQDAETTFYVSGLSNVESYEWIVPEGWLVTSLGWKAYITPTTTGPAIVTVRMRNGCNFVTDKISVCVSGIGYSCLQGGGGEPCDSTVEPCGSDPSARTVLPDFYPNPAGSELLVSFPASAEEQPGEPIYRIRIRDNQMRVMLQVTGERPEYTVDISALPRGLYTIELWWKGGTLTEQLIIE